jgi:hypothetical protein
MLINHPSARESVVKDLFMEATDDGIEALEAVGGLRREVDGEGTEVGPSADGCRQPGSTDRGRWRSGLNRRIALFLRAARSPKVPV